MNEKEFIQRSDLVLSDLSTNGGLLDPEQNNQFIRNLVDQDTILRQARVIPMTSPEMNINKIGFGERIMRPASQDRAASTPMYDGRRLTAAHRSAPTTSQVNLQTQEVITEVRLGYEMLEDTIERGALNNTILALISAKQSEELEDLFLNGDEGATAGVDPWLDMMDGIRARADAHIYDALNAPISAAIFNETLKTLPTKYRANRPRMRFISSMDTESDYRLNVSSRGTGLGDAILTGSQALPVLGVPLVGAAFMPNSELLFTNPANMIFGIQRNIRLETDRDISAREIIIVVTMRIAIQVEERDAFVKVINIG